ncbi:MAG: TonB-dependent receptor [Acidobacteriia bacterium]|nr:TonB-dependent receptor [Terriglobia bacterium]
MKFRKAGKKRAGRSRRNGWPITYRWTAIGTVVAWSAVGSKTIHVAYAQSVPPPSDSISNRPGGQPSRSERFEIASGPLSAVLPQFARAAGIRFTLSPDSIGTITSPGVSGTFTIEEALKHLLEGTGVRFRFTAPTVAIFELRGPSESVEVTGRAPGADPYADPLAPYKADRLSSAKFTEPVLNTARTETVLTQEALEDKNATTLREVLRSTAGITLGSGEGGNAFGDRFFIRGFDARNDVFVDGVRDAGVSIRETFDDEQVEILRGPASSFAGRGTTGGAMNIVTKEARNFDFYHLGVEGGLGDSTKRGTVDVNKAISPVLDVRFNGMVQYADVAGRDYTTDNRWGVAGAVAYHPTNTFRLTANYSHTYLWGLPDFGVPTNQVTREPVTEDGVPRNTFYGAVNRDFTKSTQDIGTLDAEWRINDHVTFDNKFRVSHSLLNYIGTIPENPSASGATAPYSSTLNFFSGYVQLNAQSRYEPVDVINDQPEARFKFATGEIRHSAVVGGEFSNERISIQGYSGLTSELTTGPVAFTSSGAPIVSIFNPPHYLYGAGTIQLAGNPLQYKVNTNAAYLIDTANYRDRIILSGGIRYDDYHITAANNTSSRAADNGITSYNASLLVKPVKIGSIYFAYATAADPVGAELDATSSTYGGLAATQNATQIFGPQKSRSYEVGTKWELIDRHLLLTVAPFQTDVTNAREAAPNGLPGFSSGQIVPNAAYRVRGIDFEVAGKLTNKWSVMGGLVTMDPKVTRSIVPANVGLQLANIAPQSFNLLTKYQLTRMLELGGQSIYASKIKGGSLLAANGGIAYPGVPNPTFLPSYWRFDVFVEQKINTFVSLKVTGQNLSNKTYYDSLYQSAQPFVKVAPGRVVYLSLAFNLTKS